MGHRASGDGRRGGSWPKLPWFTQILSSPGRRGGRGGSLFPGQVDSQLGIIESGGLENPGIRVNRGGFGRNLPQPGARGGRMERRPVRSAGGGGEQASRGRERMGTTFRGVGGGAAPDGAAEPSESPPLLRGDIRGSEFRRFRGFWPKTPWFTQPRRCVGKRRQSSSPSCQIKVILCRK